MIEGIISWLQLHNLSFHLKSLAVANQSQSDITILLYVLTFRRSWLFATAFLICEVNTAVNFLGVITIFYELEMYGVYGMMHHMILLFIWCSVTFKQIKGTQNKKLALSCCIMIIFLITLAMDRFINACTETWFYANSPNITVLIHALIIVSFYKPLSFIDSLVDQFRSAYYLLRYNYSVAYFCYTVKNTHQKH